MGVKCVTPQNVIDEFFRLATQIVHDEIIRALSYLCELSIVKVRDRDEIDSWYDHTGNLRSSVGYAIFEYGRKKMESIFDAIKGGTKGSNEGRKMVEELAGKYANAYAAVIMAAMSYADYVEACKNKDVLASTETWVITKIDEFLEKAKERAVKKINAIKL